MPLHLEQTYILMILKARTVLFDALDLTRDDRFGLLGTNTSKTRSEPDGKLASAKWNEIIAKLYGEGRPLSILQFKG
jgi:hypothetical protein